MALSLTAASASAEQEVTFCPPGSAAGQCEEPEGAAADTAAGNVYIADRKNHRIDVFHSDGTFEFAFGWGVDTGAAALEKCTTASGCQKGIAGSGAGQFNHPARIALDTPAGLVYVIDNENARVQKFDLAGNLLAQYVSNGACTISAGDPVAVGPTGSFYVADQGNIGKFTSTGTCVESVAAVAAPKRVNDLAVDSTGNFWASVAGAGGVLKKFSPAGAELCSPDASPLYETTAIAVDASDNVYAAQREEAKFNPRTYRIITKYSSACARLHRFGYNAFGNTVIPGLAAYDSASGKVFASQDVGLVHYLAEPPGGPIVPKASLEAPSAALSNTKATIRAEINPEGKPTTYHFEYLTEQEWEDAGETFTGAKETPPGEISATDFVLHGVEAFIGCPDPVSEAGSGNCLTPKTKYRFQVVATNADGPGEGTAEGTFTTKPPFEILETYATEAGLDSVRLNAVVIPFGIPTTGFFEYVDDATFQASGFANAAKVPDVGAGANPLDFGSSEEAVLRAATLSGLSPGTTYHYRIAVSDPLIGEEGPEQTFRTFAVPTIETCPQNEDFRTGASALLGDCRAYEMVSPLDKGNGDVIGLGEFSTGLPGALYQSTPEGDKVAYASYRPFGDAESGAFTTAYVAERGPESWVTHAVSQPRGHLDIAVVAGVDTEIRAFSPDLCEAWIRTFAEPPLTADAVPGYTNLYRRHDGGACGQKSYEALSTAKPEHIEPGIQKEVNDVYMQELEGVSADGKTTIFATNDNLEGIPTPANPDRKERLYLHTPTGTSYACILPGEVPSARACSGGTNFLQLPGQNRNASVHNALSEDGQRIFWTAYDGLGQSGGQIYVRIADSETRAVSEEAEEGTCGSSSIFLTAAADGSKAIFLCGEDLYEFEVDSETTSLIAGESAGIIGASEDASRVYLVSRETLAGANGEGRSPAAGEPNLYLAEGGAFSFIATLAAADTKHTPSTFSEASPVSFFPIKRAARVAPDGLHAVFTSFGQPTGYDNKDAKTGKADAELYRYDAGSEELRCVSCNPTNSRPTAGAMERGHAHFSAAVSIPGWENILYAANVLSADGRRVFFESTDVLSPRDSNGVEDVYGWEEPGAGTCSQQSPSYSPANGGCIDLVSSGRSAHVSEFNEASPSGEDVFFSTLAPLVAQDYGLIDIYDARIGGGLPSPSALEEECEGEACQSPAPAPEAQSPSSLGYEGPGNLEEAAKPKKCPKGKVKKNGRCVKKKKPHKKPARRSGARR